jgi:hypothetical protein
MLFMSLIQWWYGDGWRLQARKMSDRFASMTDFFSITLLLKTLFQPYRQISAGKVDGSLDERLRAFGDKLISRVIGAGIRLFILAFGVAAITLQGLIGIVLLVAWAVVPVLPILGVCMLFTRWTL